MMSYYGGGHTLPSNATAAQRAEIREIVLRGTRSNLLHTGIVNAENGHAYFFKADRYISYDLRSNHAEAGYPAPIVDTWEIPFQNNIDAGFVAGSRAYFFRGTTYVEFDLEKNALDPTCLVSGYPPTMAEHWKGWPAAWKDRTVDAAANWHDGKVYFFSGAECLRYDLAAGTVDTGYPKKIVEEFPGLPFADHLDGVILTSADAATFFAGNQACRYSPREGRVLEDPQDIRGAWPRVPASGLQGVLYTGHVDAYFFHHDQMLHYNPLRREVRKTTVPEPVASHWHLNLDHPGHCANWIDGQAVFFQGGQAQWCDLKTGNAAGAPQALSQRSRNWPKDWEQAGPQAALVWNDGTAFFFKDTQVLTVDIASGTVTHPPQRIAALWSGWPANWTRPIDAILPDWGEGEKGVIHFFSGSEFLQLDVASQSVQGRPRKITAGQWRGWSGNKERSRFQPTKNRGLHIRTWRNVQCPRLHEVERSGKGVNAA